MKTAPNYLNPEIPSGLKRLTIPIVEATAESLAGYGHIVSDTDEVEIEIVPGLRKVIERSIRTVVMREEQRKDFLSVNGREIFFTDAILQ